MSKSDDRCLSEITLQEKERKEHTGMEEIGGILPESPFAVVTD